MIRFSEADGYSLMMIDGDAKPGHVVTKSGLLLVSEGEFFVDGQRVDRLTGAELFGTHEFMGTGHAIVITNRNGESTDRLAETRDCILTPKPWGEEVEVMSVAKELQLKLITVDARCRTSEHFHRQKEETMMFFDGTEMHVRPMVVHRIEGERRYFEGSTYFPCDVVRVSDDYGRSE